MIHGLTPERTYQFRVRAKNVHGSSEPSSPSDPLVFRPPTAVDKIRDKKTVVHAQAKRIQEDQQQQDELELELVASGSDQENEDGDFNSPQFEYTHVEVQPGDPNFQVFLIRSFQCKVENI